MTPRPYDVTGRLLPAVVGLLLATFWLSGCDSSPEAASPQPSEPPTSATPTSATPTSGADPAATTRLFLPAGSDAPTAGTDAAAAPAAPLVVLVPGGSWITADPTGLFPLAEYLADAGIAAATISYRAAVDEAYFPIPPADVLCGASYATQAVRDAGQQISEVVIMGHSAGAHLSALVALKPEEFAEGCAYPIVEPEALVGMAGPYDISQVGSAADGLFTPGLPVEAERLAANPQNDASLRPEVPVLLIHGHADTTVPIVFSEQFEEALVPGGHEVTTAYLDDVDHSNVYFPEIAGPVVADWVG